MAAARAHSSRRGLQPRKREERESATSTPLMQRSVSHSYRRSFSPPLKAAKCQEPLIDGFNTAMLSQGCSLRRQLGSNVGTGSASTLTATSLEGSARHGLHRSLHPRLLRQEHRDWSRWDPVLNLQGLRELRGSLSTVTAPSAGTAFRHCRVCERSAWGKGMELTSFASTAGSKRRKMHMGCKNYSVTGSNRRSPACKAEVLTTRRTEHGRPRLSKKSLLSFVPSFSVLFPFPSLSLAAPFYFYFSHFILSSLHRANVAVSGDIEGPNSGGNCVSVITPSCDSLQLR